MALTLEQSDKTSTITTGEVVRRPWRPGRTLLLLVVPIIVVGVAAFVGARPLWSADDHDNATHDHATHDHATQDHTAYETQSAAVEPPLPGVQPAGTFDPAISVSNYDASVTAAIVDDALVFTTLGGPINQHWTDLPPGFELRAISTDGTKAALVGHQTAGDGSVLSSDILIADRSTKDTTVTTHHFDGLVEPEAFATDGGSLFVIDHQAAVEPGGYRIRPLDLETGELAEMLGPTKVPLIEDMNGSGRRQTWGFDAGRLYTLYIRQTEHIHASGHPGSDGFVHILDLDEEWAFCLDLPSTFGKGDLNTTALAVGSTTLAVLDLTAGEAGQLAYASIEDRAVTDVIDLPLSFRQVMKAMLVDAAAQPGRPAGWQPTVHLAMAGTTVAVGVGETVAWFDGATLEPLAGDPDAAYRDRVELPGPLFGLTTVPGNGVLAWSVGGQGPTQLSVPPRPIG